MKKALTILLVLVMLLAATACGNGNTSDTSAPGSSAPGSSAPESSAPGSSAPGSSAPSSSAPGSSAPVSIAPSPGTTVTERSRTVTIGSNNRPSSIDPSVLNNATDTLHMEFYYEYLVFTDHTGLKYDPMLATSWERNDDASIWTFHLREGVFFHNGEPFDADDVVCSYQYLIDTKDTSATYIGQVPTLEAVEKIDQYTVRLIFSEPYVEALNGIRAVFIFPDGAFNELGPEELFKPEHSYGTGPWILSEWADGQHTIFTKNPDYWNKANYDPYIDTIRYLHSNEPASIVAAHVAGDVNVYGPSAGMNMDLVPLYDNVLDRVELVTKMTSSSNFFLVQTGAHSPLSDINLRQAISYAIDRDLLYQTLYYGQGHAAVGLFHESMKEHDPNNTDYRYDLDLAREYLEKSSYDGRTLSFVARSSTTIEVNLSLAIADMLSVIGIIAEVQPVDSPTWNQRRNDMEYDMMFSGTPYPDQVPGRVFSQFLNDTNRTSLNDSILNDLVRAYQVEPDDAKRAELGRQIGNRVTEIKAPFLAIGNPPSVWACDWDLTGVNFFPDGVTNFTYVDFDPTMSNLPNVTNPFENLK